MNRRKFLAAGGAGLAASTIAAPAIAQSSPTINWRMATSWPKSLDTIFGGAEYFANRMAEMTDQKFQVRVFAGGEIVPPLQVLDAVQNGTVEMGHTASYYYVGKDPTFTFDATVPFGMNYRIMTSWLREAGGQDAINDFFKDYNILPMPAGNTGTQAGGWWRKEIKTVEDMKGVKFRIGGWGGAVLTKLGVVPQQLGGADIYPALEKGTIDGAEWVGPYDDEKLGFYKVAKYYYAPGWWEGQTNLSLYINLQQWNTLPKTYQAMVRTAAADANTRVLAAYDFLNPQALKRLIAGGTQLRYWSKPIMDASYKATRELYAEESARNPKFKKIYGPWSDYLNAQDEWMRVEEQQFDNYMYARKSV
ncbi:MAG: TRAP transporter substrate-binding protein DctP [Stellaceae bacterium]|jgi:TRAP-type mannitol/chloroaromatic compound transport system substrate-binding protein